MYYLLISLNILLAVFVAHLAVTFPSTDEMLASGLKIKPSLQTERRNPTESSSVAPSVAPAPVQSSSPEAERLRAAETERKIDVVVKRNIFNAERLPDAPANKNNRAAQAQARDQIRAEMRLVGTFSVGDSLGAIIYQRLQGNSQQQLRELQQKEYEKLMETPRVTDPKKVAAGEGKEAAADAASGGTNAVVAGNAVSANNVFRQYLKVGDTTVTGYKLV